MFSFRSKNKFYLQDRISMRITSRYGLTYEYKLPNRLRRVRRPARDRQNQTRTSELIRTETIKVK